MGKIKLRPDVYGLFKKKMFFAFTFFIMFCVEHKYMNGWNISINSHPFKISLTDISELFLYMRVYIAKISFIKMCICNIHITFGDIKTDYCRYSDLNVTEIYHNIEIFFPINSTVYLELGYTRMYVHKRNSERNVYWQ